MRYRREIDGLRAVAVLPVILFHAGLTFWSGGFVGVDVFFVISGYLITTILIEERARGTYTVMGFYERRARRILPALFVVLLACIPFAWIWVPPYPLEDFARSMAFAALFISNVHFLEHGGYFDLDAHLRPLLHTWSLAVEEQYYLLFPLVLFGLGAFRRGKFLIVFGALALASLAVAEWGWRNYPDENFYFTPSRLWELLAGSICAAILFRREAMKNEGLAALGLAMILAATILYDAGLPFPSLWTLVPVLGTCLIILFARSDTLTARVLSLRPLVAVGLISYSAYLWHQPVFAFARIRGAGEVAGWVMAGLVVLSLVLAWASWRFVEQPVRGRAPKLLPTRRGILGVSAAGIAMIAAAGFWTLFRDGFESRLDTEASPFLNALYVQTTGDVPFSDICFGGALDPVVDLCPAYAAPDAKMRIALLGDSHAAALMPAFEPISKDFGAAVTVGAFAGCPPLVDVWLARGGSVTANCRAAVENFSRQVIDGDTDAVVLAARWSLYTFGTYDAPDWRTSVRTTPATGRLSETERLEEFEKGLRATVAFYRAKGIGVVFVAQVPQQRRIPSILVQNAMLLGLGDAGARAMFERTFVTRADSDALQAGARAAMRRVADQMNLPMVVPDPVFARGDRFAWLDGAASLYTDDDHVSSEGARRIAPLLTSALRALDGLDAARTEIMRPAE